jgi:RNA 3'-terminal phosphate cyclase (ATP)
MVLEIDGSMGEGGGQVLRTTLSVSLLSGVAIRIVKVRHGRPKPGLARQHLTALRAAQTVGCARVEGDSVGSRQVTFSPGPVEGGEYVFDVETAGSSTLVFQTVLLPLLLRAKRPSTLVFRGGTHNPMAPPFHFLEHVFVPRLRALGAKVELRFKRFGLYPRGGGEFHALIEPCAGLGALELLERGTLLAHAGHFLVADLDARIAEREAKAYASFWEHARVQAEPVAGTGPGNVAMAQLQFEHASELITLFGARGISAEQVASNLASEAQAFIDSTVPVGEHLADQLLLPMLFGGGGCFRTGPLSLHARTQIELLRQLTGKTIEVEQGRDNVLVRVPSL